MAGTRLATMLAFVVAIAALAPAAWRLTSVERAGAEALAGIDALRGKRWLREAEPWPLRLCLGPGVPRPPEGAGAVVAEPCDCTVRAACGEARPFAWPAPDELVLGACDEREAAAALAAALAAPAAGAQQLAYRLSFSLLVEDPAARPASWAFEEAYNATLAPLVARLSALADLSVESQEVQYGRLGADLSRIASANDFSTVSVAPARAHRLEFWLFVPAGLSSETETEADALVVGDWGGAVVYPGDSAFLGPEELRPALEVFGEQLRALMGVGASETRAARAALRHHAEASVRTLLALAQLVRQMPFMQVRPRISAAAEEALAALAEMEAAADGGRLWDALAAARRAEATAERAYLDPTMVPQMYFPDEHIYAVYVPLWAPLALPLVVGLVKEVRRYRRLVSSRGSGVMSGEGGEGEGGADEQVRRDASETQ